MKLTQQQLEAHLWGAAKILRGKTAGQDYKNYILSLMFYKRLCDQWENEADEAIAEQERQQGKTFTEKQRAVFRSRGEHRYRIPDGARWGDVKAASTDIGAVLTKAMRAVSDSNDELRGVFTVDWNQPAPDGSGRPLIANEVVHALVQHFDEYDLSNRSVEPDVLGRAYEYLIKQFADDAGAKAGEFFTPSEVINALVYMLEPRPGDAVYDPTGGSGGMLVHCADYLRERGHHATSAQYFAQEMNWGNAAIAKINSVLHGLEADIEAGASTITDPRFLDNDGHVREFSLVLANFPFSDDFWWLRPEQQTDDKQKKAKLKAEVFGKEGYRDPYGRFGRGAPFHAPPAQYGDYAFILHIVASLAANGRAGVVGPQGVLFRGQPEIEEETGEFKADGTSIVRRRKADDEYLIRRALLETGIIDAVIALPLNVFYGAGLPACLVILRRNRNPEHRNKLLLVYAARHFGELSAQNELRPQDVMRIVVHYHAYGDPENVDKLVATYSERINRQIDIAERENVARIEAEYAEHDEKLLKLDVAIEAAESESGGGKKTKKKKSAASALSKLKKQREGLAAKVDERDVLIDRTRQIAELDRQNVAAVASDLVAMYKDPGELIKHAAVVDMDEIIDNEYNLNVPRYVDTFEPEEPIDVSTVLGGVSEADARLKAAEDRLTDLLRSAGYAG